MEHPPLFGGGCVTIEPAVASSNRLIGQASSSCNLAHPRSLTAMPVHNARSRSA
jgi:hypothetical protein